jgi:hypothetical protein
MESPIITVLVVVVIVISVVVAVASLVKAIASLVKAVVAVATPRAKREKNLIVVLLLWITPLN